jgi:hypothetical protein
MAAIIMVTRIGELGTKLAVNSYRSTLRRNTSSLILFTLMMEAISSSERLFLQESHGVTSQKKAFLKITAVKISNLT